MVLDLACSAVARSNIDLAAERGEPIPEGWALGPDGRPTTDAQQALLGAVLPFAGHKGSGLAVVMGALAGVLSGANFGAAVPPLSDYRRERDLGHVLDVVDVRALGDAGALAERMDRYVGEISGSAPMPGVDRVRVPGEAGNARRRERLERGIAVPQTLVEEFRALAGALGLSAAALDGGCAPGSGGSVSP